MGFEHAQVNTNGVVLGEREGDAATLAEAGVTAVSLRFDGLTAETYEAIRGVDLVEEDGSGISRSWPPRRTDGNGRYTGVMDDLYRAPVGVS